MFQKLAYACNPYLPGKEHVPDGEPYVFEGRLYVYGSHDEVGTDRYCTGSYVGWSAPLDDLGDWRYEGVILEKGQDPLDPEGTKDYYAPDVVRGADGRYYLYYSIEGSLVISVAVCDTPAGRFRFYGHVKDQTGHIVGSQKGDAYQFDPAVLADDDGRFYLYSGQGIPIPEVEGRKVRGSMVCELEADMLTMKGEQKTITSREENCFEENPFFEASSIRKIGGTYYFIYSPLPNTHFLCYATSDRPDRDFRYRGVLVSNADIFPEDPDRQLPKNYWGNNHGSLVEIGEELYIFYHKNTNKSPFARQGCAEKIECRPDGSLVQAELTSQGLYGAPLQMKGEHAAYIAWQLERKQMKPFVPFQFLEYDELDPYVAEEEKTDIPYIANLTDGAKAGYRYMRFDGTETEFFIKARGTGTGTVIVKKSGKGYVRIPVLPSEGWQEFHAACTATEEVAEICLEYEGEGSLDLLALGMRSRNERMGKE